MVASRANSIRTSCGGGGVWPPSPAVPHPGPRKLPPPPVPRRLLRPAVVLPRQRRSCPVSASKSRADLAAGSPKHRLNLASTRAWNGLQGPRYGSRGRSGRAFHWGAGRQPWAVPVPAIPTASMPSSGLELANLQRPIIHLHAAGFITGQAWGAALHMLQHPA